MTFVVLLGVAGPNSYRLLTHLPLPYTWDDLVVSARITQHLKEVHEQARSLMQRQLDQIVRLVDDLLDVSRISTGKLELRRERVNLKEVVAAGDDYLGSVRPARLPHQGVEQGSFTDGAQSRAARAESASVQVGKVVLVPHL